jgi:polyhydroxybutyrate depolymerase
MERASRTSGRFGTGAAALGLLVAHSGVVAVGALAGCGHGRAPQRMSEGALRGGDDGEYEVPGYPDRGFLVHLPPSYDGTKPIAIVLGLHGGGGKKEGFHRLTCPSGKEDGESCLHRIADREGFAVVIPDGVPEGARRGRHWNAGGGKDGYRCVGGDACAQGYDDVAYFDALLDEVRRTIHVDEARIYAMGMSNGGAMSHRLACERANVFAAVASVAGANQALSGPGCSPSRPIPVMHVHGSADPCWGYRGAIRQKLCEDGREGRFVTAEASAAGWRERNECTGATEERVENAWRDGMRTTRLVGTGCAAETELWRVDGGGHTWPSGWPYLEQSIIGPTTRDFSATEEIWRFFARNARASSSGAR